MSNTVGIWRNTKELHNFLGKKGKIVVWTKIFVPPAGYEKQVPYIVGIIEFPDGKRKTLQIVDAGEELKVGQEVVLIVRRIGKAGAEDVIEYGIKAKPL